MPNAPHLTESDLSLRSYFLSLDKTILNPLTQTTQAVANSVVPTVAVAPTPDIVATPGTQNTFSDKAPDVSATTRTR